MDPIYAPGNCSVAYQLNWSLSVFTRKPIPSSAIWLSDLKEAVEKDDVRILEHYLKDDTVHQFLISTKPHVTPAQTIRSIKGRLQYLIRKQNPKAFRRNYHIQSVGSANRECVEEYIRTQQGHHKMADERVHERLAAFQIHNGDVELGEVRRSAHGQFVHNLHVVLVHRERYAEVREEALKKLCVMIQRASEHKGHLLSEAGILADHLHLALGCGVDESPMDVALSYLNNLAFTQGMKPVYQFGCYIGTFGEYDLGAIRNVLAET